MTGMYARCLLALFALLGLPTIAGALVLDDYASDAHFAAGHYVHYGVWVKPGSQGPMSGTVVVSDGTLKVETRNPSGATTAGTSAHMWARGETLQRAGDRVSIEITSNVLTSATSGGLYLDGDLEGPAGGAEIRMYQPGNETLLFVGPWGDTVIDVSGLLTQRPFAWFQDDLNPANSFDVKLEIEVIASNAGQTQLRAALSSDLFATHTEEFTINAPTIYFGPAAYTNRTNTAGTLYITEHDNLVFVPEPAGLALLGLVGVMAARRRG